MSAEITIHVHRLGPFDDKSDARPMHTGSGALVQITTSGGDVTLHLYGDSVVARFVPIMRRLADDLERLASVPICRTCRGTGETQRLRGETIVDDTCHACDGAGRTALR